MLPGASAPTVAADMDISVPPAISRRARLAQAVALQDGRARWQRCGWVVSPPVPRLRLVDASYARPNRPGDLWQASCGGCFAERAQAAQRAALRGFLDRPRKPNPPLRSI